MDNVNFAVEWSLDPMGGHLDTDPKRDESFARRRSRYELSLVGKLMN